MHHGMILCLHLSKAFVSSTSIVSSLVLIHNFISPIHFNQSQRGSVVKLLICFILCFFLSGCSSLVSRVGEETTWGTPYSGLGYSMKNAENCNIYVLMATFPVPLPLLLSIPISLVDIGGAAVLDTLLLPIDLAVTPTNEYRSNICYLGFGK
jgi:uncharacterized protein YceK